MFYSGNEKYVILRLFRFRFGILCLLFSITLPATLFAQSPGALRGRVVDPSGAVVPNATISVKSASGQETTATSGADGSYEIRGLAPGQYYVGVYCHSSVTGTFNQQQFSLVTIR